MNIEQPMEDRLWDYIDGGCTPAEMSAIDALLAANREWQEKYRELLTVHELLHTSELDAPSLRFTKTVMEEIARYQVAPATRNYINKNIIRGIGAFFLTMILGLLVYVLAQFKWNVSGSGSSNLLPVHSNLGVDRGVDLGVDRFTNAFKAVNGTWLSLFMLVSVVMGFILLDLYLQRKKAKATAI